MQRISRYVFVSVFSAIALTSLVFLSLYFIFSLIEQLGSLRGNYTAIEAVKNVLLRLPYGFYAFNSFACLIGCLVGLGLLATSSELVIIRAAGVSTQQIVWMVLKPALVFIAAALIVGEFVTPYTEQLAVARKAVALGSSVKQSRQYSWQQDGKEFIHFDAVLPNGEAYGIARYRFDDNRQLLSASFSEKAVYQNDHWQETGVKVTHFNGDKTSQEYLVERRWDSKVTPSLLTVLVQNPLDLSIRDSYFYIQYLLGQKLDFGDYSLAFWRKCLAPVATASLVLVAISFIFGPLRSVTLGQRVFTGILFGLIFEIVQRLTGPSSLVFGFPPFLAVLIPILGCVCLGVFLLKRSR